MVPVQVAIKLLRSPISQIDRLPKSSRWNSERASLRSLRRAVIEIARKVIARENLLHFLYDSVMDESTTPTKRRRTARRVGYQLDYLVSIMYVDNAPPSSRENDRHSGGIDRHDRESSEWLAMSYEPIFLRSLGTLRKSCNVRSVVRPSHQEASYRRCPVLSGPHLTCRDA